jgi:hypothetical protein
MQRLGVACGAGRRDTLYEATANNAVAPAVDDRVALVRFRVEIGVVACAPETIEGLWIALAPARRAKVGVRKRSLTIRFDVSNVLVDGQARIS